MKYASRRRQSSKLYKKRRPAREQSVALVRQPVFLDSALKPLNYATYNLSVLVDLHYGSNAPPGQVVRPYSVAFARF